MRTMTANDLRREGQVIVGEFGFGTISTSGYIVCRPEDRAAVQAAYDEIKEGDLSEHVLDAVIAAGGEHVLGF